MSTLVQNPLANVCLNTEICKHSPRNSSLLQSGFSVCGAPEPWRWISWWSPLSLMSCWATRVPGDAATHYRDPGWRRGGGEKRKSFALIWQINFGHEASLTRHFPASTATRALPQSFAFALNIFSLPSVCFLPPSPYYFSACRAGRGSLSLRAEMLE